MIQPRFGRSRGMTHPRCGQSLAGKRDRSRAVGEAMALGEGMDGVAAVEEAGEVGLRRLGAAVVAPAVAAVE